MTADRSAAFGVNSYSYTFEYTAARFLTKLAARGFRTFELIIYPGHLWPKTLSTNDRTALRRRIESLDVRVVSLNMPNLDVNIAAASEEVRTVSLEHLERMQHSAEQCGFPFYLSALGAHLQRYAGNLQVPRKVRVLLDADGHVAINDEAVKPSVPVRAALALAPVRSDDLLLQHKSTARGPYDAALAAVQHLGVQDVLLWNERHELTETASANLVLFIDGAACTPMLSSGLLAGTYRDYLLQAGVLQERVLRTSDLPRSDSLWLINSVRRWCSIECVNSPNRQDKLIRHVD